MEKREAMRARLGSGVFFKPNLQLFDLIFLQFFRIEDCDPVPMGHWVITEAPGLLLFCRIPCTVSLLLSAILSCGTAGRAAEFWPVGSYVAQKNRRIL